MSLHKRISRRTVLRGAGAAMCLPFMEMMAPHRVASAVNAVAAAAVKPPVRMGIFTVTGGTVLESWKLPAPGPLTKLPSILRPLEGLNDDMLLVTGLSHTGQTDNLNGHEGAAFLHLTGAEKAKKESGRIQSSISVDQAAAQGIGDQTFLPSLEIGLAGWETRYSFRSPNIPVPFEADPRLIFERMFRGRKPVVPNWQRRAAEDSVATTTKSKTDNDEQSVVDLLMAQAKDLRGTLGKADQGKLDEYLESVRSVEKRIAFIESRQRQEILDLQSPGPSKLIVPEMPKGGVPLWQVTRPLNDDPEKQGDYLRLMADMMVLAFQTDTTRVCTFAVGSDESLFPGVVTVGYERHCHTLEHQGNSGRPEDADPIAREALRQIHAWYTTVFAEMAKKMKNIDEGGSSLLDNSMLLYTSYMADGGHGREDYPVLLVGKAGGSLETGRQVTFENKAPAANLYVEMLDRVGVKVDKFGDSHTSRYAGNLNGRLPGLV
jgi:hypothetical protein